MKKICYVAVAALLLTACGGNGNSSAVDSNAGDAVANDSVAVVAEEPAPEELTTPDLTLLEVKGNVKRIENVDMATGATFDKEGTLLTYVSDGKISNVKRNDKGQLTDFLGADWMTVTWDGDRPAKIVDSFNELTLTDTYTYNDKGLVEKIVNRHEDAFEELDETTTLTFTYAPEDFDAHGNWLKRSVKLSNGNSYTSIRKIEYYE